MDYKHRETGIYYKCNSASRYKGKSTKVFTPFNKSLNLESIRLSCDWTIDTDKFPPGTPVEEYWKANTINDEPLEKQIDEIFEKVNLKPEYKVTEVPKYIKVQIDIKCPLCGESLIWDGSALLSDPLQYYHKCEKCGYDDTLLYHQGQVLLGTSTEEVYNILNNGTREERKELLSRKSCK